jgi:hypothetical protein
MGVTRLKRKDRKNKTTSRLEVQFLKLATNIEPGSRSAEPKNSQIAKNNACFMIKAGCFAEFNTLYPINVRIIRIRARVGTILVQDIKPAVKIILETITLLAKIGVGEHKHFVSRIPDDAQDML